MKNAITRIVLIFTILSAAMSGTYSMDIDHAVKVVDKVNTENISIIKFPTVSSALEIEQVYNIMALTNKLNPYNQAIEIAVANTPEAYSRLITVLRTIQRQGVSCKDIRIHIQPEDHSGPANEIKLRIVERPALDYASLASI